MMPNPEAPNRARIKVVGVGGGGGNAVTRMMQAEVRGIELIAVNTDVQALERTAADRRIAIGAKVTGGLGAGGYPSVGTKAAEESSDELFEALRDSDMVFITAGMGGGTGTGAAPVIAQIARETEALTVAVVTKPFTFEGYRRRQNAEEGIAALKEKVDALIVIPNDRLLQLADKKTTVEAAFRLADEVLHQGIQGIAEVITVPGLINPDFADVKAIMAGAGSALMAIGRGQGEERAVEAAKAAIASPLLEVSVNGAKGILLNFVGGPDMTLFELAAAAEVVGKVADQEANIKIGAVIDPRMENEIRITLIATGFDSKQPPQAKSLSVARAVREPAPAPAPVPEDDDIVRFFREATRKQH